MGSLLPHLHRDSTRRCHICTGTKLTAATSAPGLGLTAATSRVVRCVCAQLAGGSDGLGLWAAKNRSLADADLVVWYSVGFHHVTLQENMPVLPTFWGAEFSLAPANFFSQNPALDLPRA